MSQSLRSQSRPSRALSALSPQLLTRGSADALFLPDRLTIRRAEPSGGIARRDRHAA